MSLYFSLPAFARAKKNKDELQKSNPQNPVLKDEDEKFLERQISQDQAARLAKEVETTKISDDGDEKPAISQDQKSVPQEQVVVPGTQPESPTNSMNEKKSKKHKDMELPSQEEAEAATRGWNEQVKLDEHGNKVAAEKKTWASYIASSLNPIAKKDDPAVQAPNTADSTTDAAAQTKQTWAEYAGSYVPDSWKKAFSKDPDSRPEPVYNDDGTVNEAATKEKQEREISVLLDNLNMSSINNRVFALSDSTHDIYERFSLVLKDTINGGPTAYDDMDKLMREAGPQLEKQFKSMPPFVQTLVKSLPAKLGTTMAPELMAAASEKPGHDMSEQLKAASAASKDFAGASKAAAGKATGEASKTKKKTRRIPGLKSLVSKEGAVATILRNTVTFLQTRFPFLASGTNVVMSLAVFILMFVFWYCHKRGKEVRLAKEAEAGSSSQQDGAAGAGKGDDDDDDDDIEDEETDEGDDNTAVLEEKLKQTDPKDVPLPAEAKDEPKAA